MVLHARLQLDNWHERIRRLEADEDARLRLDIGCHTHLRTLKKAHEQVVKTGLVLEPELTSRWIDECLEILTWLSQHIQTALNEKYKSLVSSGISVETLEYINERLKGYTCECLEFTFEIIAFQMKIDKERKSEDQLKSVVCNLIRSFPESNANSTLLQELVSFHSCFRSCVLSSFADRYIVTKLLLECESDPNVLDTDGNSPLHLLACTAEYFFDHLVDGPRHKSKSCQRVFQDIKACAVLLLQHGAHVDAKNKRGETASEVFFKFPVQGSFDIFPYVTLRCLAARILRSSGYPMYMIPKEFTKFVMLH